jgi:hypothetical protein
MNACSECRCTPHYLEHTDTYACLTPECQYHGIHFSETKWQETHRNAADPAWYNLPDLLDRTNRACEVCRDLDEQKRLEVAEIFEGRSVMEACRQLLIQGEKIRAIKLYRTINRNDLRQCKEAVEALADSPPLASW